MKDLGPRAVSFIVIGPTVLVKLASIVHAEIAELPE